MNNYQIKVVEPGAIKLLEDMASLNLIELMPLEPEERFKQLLSKMRSKENEPSLEKITGEVELVREQRYTQSRGDQSVSLHKSLDQLLNLKESSPNR